MVVPCRVAGHSQQKIGHDIGTLFQSVSIQESAIALALELSVHSIKVYICLFSCEDKLFTVFSHIPFLLFLLS